MSDRSEQLDAAAAAERREGRPESHESRTETKRLAEAAGGLQDSLSEAETLASHGTEEIARLVGEANEAGLDAAADPDVVAAKKELAAVEDEGRTLAGRAKQRVTGVLSRLRRFAGATGIAAAMTMLEACATMGAGAKPEAGIEHVDRGSEEAKAEARIKRELRERALADAGLRKDFAKRFGEEKAVEKLEQFLDTFDEWDGVGTLDDLAELADEDYVVPRQTFKGIEVWSEERFEKEMEQQNLSPRMDAMVKNDIAFIRSSRFFRADGSFDKAKIQHGLDHELLHLNTREENVNPLTGDRDRLWDHKGVSHELNEGVTELVALRLAEKRGLKLEDQAYAGGNLAAARLLEGIVGTEELAADYVTGKTDRIKEELEDELGPGAYEAIAQPDFESAEKLIADRPDGLAAAFDIVKAARAADVDIDEIWSDAKEEGMREDLRVSPDGRAIVLSRDIEGKLVLANSVVEAAPASPDAPPLRVFILAKSKGDAYSPDSLAATGEGLRRSLEIDAEVRAQTQKEFDAAGPDAFADDEARQAAFKTIVQSQVKQRQRDAHLRGEKVSDFNVVFNVEGQLKGLQTAYEKAPTPEAKAAVKKRIEAEVERLARSAAEQLTARAAGQGNEKTAP